MRRQTSAEPRTGDGAGILHADADEVLEAAVVDSRLPALGGLTGVAGCASCRPTRKGAASLGELAGRGPSPARGQAPARLGRGTCRVRPAPAGGRRRRGACRPAFAKLGSWWAGPERSRDPGPRSSGKAVRDRRICGDDSRASPACNVASSSSRRSTTRGICLIQLPGLAAFYPGTCAGRAHQRRRAWRSCKSRFSTNTFPSWGGSQPLSRDSATTGRRSTTVRGNILGMGARRVERAAQASCFGTDLEKEDPLARRQGPGNRLGGTFDKRSRRMLMLGRQLAAHAAMMMDPRGPTETANGPVRGPQGGFYAITRALMEPVGDGPHSVMPHRRRVRRRDGPYRPQRALRPGGTLGGGRDRRARRARLGDRGPARHPARGRVGRSGPPGQPGKLFCRPG